METASKAILETCTKVFNGRKWKVLRRFTGQSQSYSLERNPPYCQEPTHGHRRMHLPEQQSKIFGK